MSYPISGLRRKCCQKNENTFKKITWERIFGIFDHQKKADGLTHLCTLENITTDKTVFIGDNENDLWIAKKAGYSIAFNCKSKKLAKICNVEIKPKDLTLLLPLIS